MTSGPRGEKRPADLISMSVMVAKISTVEIEGNAKSGRVCSGNAAARVRAKKLPGEERTETAHKAANARWE